MSIRAPAKCRFEMNDGRVYEIECDVQYYVTDLACHAICTFPDGKKFDQNEKDPVKRAEMFEYIQKNYQPVQTQPVIKINPKCKEATCKKECRAFSAYCSEECKKKDYDSQLKESIKDLSDGEKLKNATVELMAICKKNNIKKFLYSINAKGRITVDVELKDGDMPT